MSVLFMTLYSSRLYCVGYVFFRIYISVKKWVNLFYIHRRKNIYREAHD